MSGGSVELGVFTQAASREEVADIIKRFKAGLAEVGIGTDSVWATYGGVACREDGTRIDW